MQNLIDLSRKRFSELSTEVSSCDFGELTATAKFKIAIIHTIVFLQKNCTGICLVPQDDFEVYLQQFNRFYLEANNIQIENVQSKLKSKYVQNVDDLCIALHIFTNFESADSNEEILKQWWLMRVSYLQQMVLFEQCPQTYKNIQHNIEYLFQKVDRKSNYFQLLCFETFEIYLMYQQIVAAKNQFEELKSLQHFEFTLTGKLGKRTRFQEKDVAQLMLNVQITDTVEDRFAFDNPEEEILNDLPYLAPLNDEIRLNNTQYQEEQNIELNEIEQLVLLGQSKYLMKAKPILHDNLTREEIQCYLDAILNQKSTNWCIRVNAMLIQCQLDKFNKRTIERSLNFFESILKQIDNTSASSFGYCRWRFFWACGHQLLSYNIECELARRYKDLALLNNAADLYFKLENWSELVECYCIMNRNQDAINLIEKLLEDEPDSVRLWTLYGDLKEDTQYYEKAWQISGERSALAQKRWGYYYYDRRDYNRCIEHFEKSLELNFLQSDVLFRLGYAAICIENYQMAVRYYRDYTNFEIDCFEAWNNLDCIDTNLMKMEMNLQILKLKKKIAKSYYHLKDYKRAASASKESIKYDYDNWKLWDNFMVFSFQAENYEDTVRAFHRLLDLKPVNKVIACNILSVLCEEYSNDNCPNELKKKISELMARVTIVMPSEPKFWKMYASLTKDSELKAQRYLKCYRALNQIGNVNDLEEFLHLASLISKFILDNSIKDRSLLQSIKLMLNSVLALFRSKTAHLDTTPEHFVEYVSTIEQASHLILNLLAPQ